MEGAGIEEGILGRREARSQYIEAGGGEVERKFDMHMKARTVIDSGSQATDPCPFKNLKLAVFRGLIQSVSHQRSY